jgi:hypothetical protein
MKFTREFATEDELRQEYSSNLVVGGLRVPASERAALHATVDVTLRGPAGAEVNIRGTVVAQLPDGIALTIDANPDQLLEQLLVKPAESSSPWERMRALSQMEKLLLAVKADRSERAILLQDNDPRVLLSILRNPRLTIDEVVRVAKSSYLNFQIADVIMKTGQWMASLDVRLALVHNGKTPQAFALRILPTLPDAEVRGIARGGTSMALKTAALKQLQRGS